MTSAQYGERQLASVSIDAEEPDAVHEGELRDHAQRQRPSIYHSRSERIIVGMKRYQSPKPMMREKEMAASADTTIGMTVNTFLVGVIWLSLSICSHTVSWSSFVDGWGYGSPFAQCKQKKTIYTTMSCENGNASRLR